MLYQLAALASEFGSFLIMGLANGLKAGLGAAVGEGVSPDGAFDMGRVAAGLALAAWAASYNFRFSSASAGLKLVKW